jgi:hypothetical protein
MSYYKKIEKREYFYKNAPIAPQKSYNDLRGRKGVVVSSDENGEFLLVPTAMVDEYVPTTISREDLISRGFDPSKLTDKQMQEIADKMGDLWVGFSDYWDEMDSCAEEFGLTNDGDDEDDDDEDDDESKRINSSATNVPIKGVKCTEIHWCIDSSDVPDADNMTEEEVEKAIDEIEATLPECEYFPLPHFTIDYNEVKEFVRSLDERMSNKYGYLLYSFNYKLIGIDGEEYEFWHRN